jgi:hypothetical protein
MADPNETEVPPHYRFQLFHRLGDPSSSRVRAHIVQLKLEGVVAFRNVAFDSHREAFERRHGRLLPAIWDGALLYEGEVACEAFLGDIARSEGQGPA